MNTQSQYEKKKLKTFMEAGTEKIINTHHVKADEIIETAQQFLGVPHCMSVTNMKCVDCSGLLVTVFAKYGIVLPHSSEEQARYGKIIAGMDELKEGDMIFFINSYKTNKLITHSAIYIGDNKFIHTSNSKGVSITSLNDPYWSDKFIFGTRILNSSLRKQNLELPTKPLQKAGFEKIFKETQSAVNVEATLITKYTGTTSQR